MHINSFDYYGYDKDSYLDCREMVSKANRNQILLLNSWFVVMVLCYILFSGFNLFGVTQERIIFYAIYFLIGVSFELVLIFLKKIVVKYNFVMVYTSIAILLSYGILVSVAHPYMPAVIYLIFVTLISLMYIHTMWRISLTLLAASGIFIYCSYRYKTFSIAYNDTYNLAVVLIISIGLHYTFQRNRLSQVILYLQNLHIQRELEVKSCFDTLSKLLNRGFFFSVSEKMIRKTQGMCNALCLIDLDGFKQINDTYGHQMGDKAIQLTGKAMLELFGIGSEMDKDIVVGAKFTQIKPIIGRLGGDEFIVLFCGEKDRDSVLEKLKQILAALNSISEGPLNGIHASLGATIVPAGEFDMDAAYKRADLALYKSKRSGKNQINFYEDEKNNMGGE